MYGNAKVKPPRMFTCKYCGNEHIQHTNICQWCRKYMQCIRRIPVDVRRKISKVVNARRNDV